MERTLDESIVQWAGWRSNPRLHLFRVALNHLSYRPFVEADSSLARLN